MFEFHSFWHSIACQPFYFVYFPKVGINKILNYCSLCQLLTSAVNLYNITRIKFDRLCGHKYDH